MTFSMSLTQCLWCDFLLLIVVRSRIILWTGNGFMQSYNVYGLPNAFDSVCCLFMQFLGIYFILVFFSCIIL